MQALASLLSKGSPQPQDRDDSNTSHNITKSGSSKPGPSNYEQERQANIARNKQLLDSLGLGEGSSHHLEILPKKGKAKKKKHVI